MYSISNIMQNQSYNNYYTDPVIDSTSYIAKLDRTIPYHPALSSRELWNSKNRFEVNRDGGSGQEIQDPTESSTTFDRHGALGGIVAFLGLSGLIIPLLTLISFPIQLLNPNLLIAKGLTLLSIPVGIGALGRSFDESIWLKDFRHFKRSDEVLSPWIKFLYQLLHPEGSRGLAKNNQRNATKEPEQCLERIACEGVLKTLPQIFLKSILNGQVDLFWNYRRNGNNSNNKNDVNVNNNLSSEKVNNSTDISSTPVPATPEVTSRRKHLAKFALNRVKNRTSQLVNRIRKGSNNYSSQGNYNRPSNSNDGHNSCFKYKCSFML